MTALGFVSLLERYRFPIELESPAVAIPDVRPLIERAEARAAGALQAADRAQLIAGALEDDDDPGVERLASAVADAEAQAGGLRADARALGTVLLGATSQQPESDEIHLVEHAVSCAVVELCEDTLLRDDVPAPTAATETELVTEVAGYVCRLLCEAPQRKASGVEFSNVPGGWFERTGWVGVRGNAESVSVHFQGTALTLDDATVARVHRAGWPEGSIAVGEPRPAGIAAYTTFEAPVTVSEVAQLVARTLVDLLDCPDLQAAPRCLDASVYL